MIIDNVYVFTPDKAFVKGGIILDGDKIRQVYEEKDAPQLSGDVMDGKGCYAIPGLIDLHFHGCKGDDFCDGDKDAIGRIAEYEASVGVTAIAPATMTLPVEELEQILHTAAEYKKETKDCRKADFLGINMEGPFISPAKKGAQDARNILPCNVEICDRFLKASEGLVKFMKGSIFLWHIPTQITIQQWKHAEQEQTMQSICIMQCLRLRIVHQAS